MSAKSVNPKLLIGIESVLCKDELKIYNVNFSIKDYNNLDIYEIKQYQNDNITILLNMISNAMKCGINNINIDTTKLKGGFIADVIAFKIAVGHENLSLVLKFENNEINNLSSMAHKIQLYSREYYFYKTLSRDVNIKVPQFYNILLDSNGNEKGLILENLLEKKYKINLNLNIESIDVSLKIVNRMARLHAKYWNTNLKKEYPEFKKTDDPLFLPFFKEFITEKYEIFISKWDKILNQWQKQKCNEIFQHFDIIQKRLSSGNLTFIHGDIKSPNIFYDVENDYEPYFIDWQHCGIGKGVQDLIFFIIESFDIDNVVLVFNLAKHYYYKKIVEYGVVDYTFEQYQTDILDAMCYVPYFTSIWFGSTPADELIDKNFPYFFITKLFYLIQYVCK